MTWTSTVTERRGAADSVHEAPSPVDRAAQEKRPGLGRRLREGYRSFWRRVEGPGAQSNATYYLILGTTLALVVIGLMMVFSASSVELTATDQNPFTLGLKQSGFALVGLVAMMVLSRLPIRFYQSMAWPVLGLTMVLLVLVLVIGRAAGGNKNWIDIAGFSLQPSEIAKLALAVWMAALFSRKEALLSKWSHLFIPVVPVAALVVGLVLLEGDLGTSVIMMTIAAAGLYFAGAPARIFVGAALIGVLGAVVLAVTNPNRVARLTAWFSCGSPSYQDTQGFCDQAQNGMFAFASGGWFGVGLGQGRQKWHWIPEAQNDFIFSIIGEEFGLIGTVLVIALFMVLAVAMFRITIHHQSFFVRVACGSIMVWITGQAFVNIAMVTGLLPVIGVPLPFISSGGTAMVSAMAGIGVVLSFARQPRAPKAPPVEQGATSSSGKPRKESRQRKVKTRTAGTSARAPRGRNKKRPASSSPQTAALPIVPAPLDS
ncbi:putative lipid II flippase FtsW [Psychromicrobium xiongbiense]|uniref:putative lipid II flippase FtsW n=1 Tax=Psychromicrobium xiongbiense TaxID=3051184 RepID=UPI00255712A3|nr:putative lipid II flippase FtsW [Psychromicrobium sp. YIM S02556]